MKRWLHRDLKPANILVKLGDDSPSGMAAASGAEPTLKLADFGLARPLPQDKKMELTMDVCTLWYRAPEILLGDVRYGYASDVWAIGCVCIEMSELKPAFAESSEFGMLIKIFKALGSPRKKEWPRLFGLARYREGLFPNFRGGLDSKLGLRIGPLYNDLLQGVVRVAPDRRWSAEASRIFCTSQWPAFGGREHMG